VIGDPACESGDCWDLAKVLPSVIFDFSSGAGGFPVMGIASFVSVSLHFYLVLIVR